MKNNFKKSDNLKGVKCNPLGHKAMHFLLTIISLDVRQVKKTSKKDK